MTHSVNLHSKLSLPFAGLGSKREASRYRKELSKEDLTYYLSQVSLIDNSWWQTTVKLATEAKRFADANWKENYEQKAQTVLIAAYCMTRPNAAKQTEIEECVRYLLKELSSIERGRLAKMLALIPGQDGKLLRKFLYPMIYHCREAENIPSDQELLQEALEIVCKLDKCSSEILQQLDLPVLNKFPGSEQKRLITEWKAVLTERRELLNKGYEILFPRYYSRHFPEGETELTTTFPQEVFTEVIDCHSVTIEGLHTTFTPLSDSDCLEGAYKASLCSKSYLPNLIPEKNLLTVAYLAANDPKKFGTERKYQIVEKSIAQLDAAFLAGRLPTFIPRSWPAPNHLSNRQLVIPSKNSVAKRILELTAPKILTPATPLLTSSSGELTIIDD